MIPELSSNLPAQIRIPPEVNVGVTNRVLEVLDAPAMQRLKHISQLGLVTHVYPGAAHSRFEHSLGVYRLAQLVLNRLMSSWTQWADTVSDREIRIFLLAALLHDVGHWPFCHPIEDMGLDWVPKHEELARHWIMSDDLSRRIVGSWDVDPEEVVAFLTQPADNITPGEKLLRSVLNGPIDIDKMDYLQRDSLHAGVPYGKNFDLHRLIGSMVVDQDRLCLAITEKGKTAAEMLLFGRYVMFSEVYWHHAVRSATAMLQRLIYHLGPRSQPERWMTSSDVDFVSLVETAARREMPQLLVYCQGIFGNQRRLFKRVIQFNDMHEPELYRRIAFCSYAQLDQLMIRLAEQLCRATGRQWSPWEVLIDAPPAKLEVQFDVRIGDASGNPSHMQPLAKVSPIVQALATEQFDRFVKRVRVFVAPDRVDELRRLKIDMRELLEELTAEGNLK